MHQTYQQAAHRLSTTVYLNSENPCLEWSTLDYRSASKRKAPSPTPIGKGALQDSQRLPQCSNFAGLNTGSVHQIIPKTGNPGAALHVFGGNSDHQRTTSMEFTEMKRAINKVLLIGNLGSDFNSPWSGAMHRIERAFTFEPSKAGKGAMNWTNISDGSPESGGGGASATITTDGGGPAVAASSDDDDGGDADPEPARRRHPKSASPSTHQNPQHSHDEALLKLQAVQSRTSLSKSTIYAKIKDGTFPEPVRLGARCSRWKSSDLNNWLSQVGQ